MTALLSGRPSDATKAALAPIRDAVRRYSSLRTSATTLISTLRSIMRPRGNCPARQSSPTQLQICANRISQARFIDRPQRKPDPPCIGRTKTTGRSGAPSFGPTMSLDFELEAGVLIGSGNRRGEPIPIDEAERHVSGCAWSTTGPRAICRRRSVSPLGPFLARVLPPRYRPGLCLWKRWLPVAFLTRAPRRRSRTYGLFEEHTRRAGRHRPHTRGISRISADAASRRCPIGSAVATSRSCTGAFGDS